MQLSHQKELIKLINWSLNSYLLPYKVKCCCYKSNYLYFFKWQALWTTQFNFLTVGFLIRLKISLFIIFDISITSQDSFPTYKAAFYPKIRHWIFLYRDRVKFNAMNSETGGLFTSIMQKHHEQNYKSHFWHWPITCPYQI